MVKYEVILFDDEDASYFLDMLGTAEEEGIFEEGIAVREVERVDREGE